jgi:hypothetical protein
MELREQFQIGVRSDLGSQIQGIFWYCFFRRLEPQMQPALRVRFAQAPFDPGFAALFSRPET